MSFAITATMAAAAVGAATSIMSIRAQNQAIEDQNYALMKQQQDNNAITQMNYALKQQQEAEAKAATGMELTSQAIQRYEERGKIRAAQAESGLAGVSPLRELANSYMQQSITSGSIVAKGEADQRSLALQSQANYLQALSDANRLESQKQDYNDGAGAWLQTAFSAGSGALAGYGMAGAMGAGSGTFTSAATGNTVGTTSSLSSSALASAQQGVQAGVLNFTPTVAPALSPTNAFAMSGMLQNTGSAFAQK